MSEHRSGYVALLGRPNVGKSTLLNRFLGEDCAIVSPRPQTTRANLLGILSRQTYQIIFVDTPGIHQPATALGRHMVRSSSEALKDADILLALVDARGVRAEDRRVLRLLRSRKDNPVWTAVLLNKADLTDRETVEKTVADCRRSLPDTDIFLISALTGENVEAVLNTVVEKLPSGPAYFPEDQLTDRNERFLVAEFIREQVLFHLREEIPHAVAVQVEEMKEREGRKTLIQATVYVERESQKSIIIGKHGDMLKQVGVTARGRIEKFLDRPIYLELWVKVKHNWRKDEAFLKRLGLDAQAG